MYVAPEARGQGVGKALLQEVISRASELAGLEQINLMVVTTNIAARRLYLSLGFRVYGLEYHAMKRGDVYWDEELMVLVLSHLG
jgi:ribosomal protein S18 acetylase RimI-like enzyme